MDYEMGPMDYRSVLGLLEAHFAKGVTDGVGVHHTWVYTFQEPRYGRKWMTRRARAWKARRWSLPMFTVERAD